MAKQNKPAIRFKGFTDAWEQRKLGEILQERNTRTSDFESNPLYSLTIESGVTPKTDRYERSSLVTKTEDLFKTVKPNEFVTNPMNLRFGALGYNKNAFTVSVSGYYDVFSIDDDKCSGFWNAYFKTPTAMNIFDNAATGSLIEKRRVKYSTLQQLAFYMPNDLSEKAEIGKYMDTFDHLITLHQRKYDKLQVLKKAMLEKMFPKNGSSVPEIRFKGFTDAWEQRKLEDYLTVSAEKNTGNIYDRSDVLSVSGDYGIVNQIEFQGRSFAGASVSNYGVVQTGDVVYTKSPLNSNPYGIIKTNKGKPGIVSTLYAVYHPKGNAFSDFIQVYFEQHARMNNYMHPLVNKGAKNDMKVSAENALKGPVCFPSRIEQESISVFFSVLDNLITLHQRKPYSHIQRRCNMLNEAQSTDKFCEYYAKWITVYKKGAIRQVTMDKYLMTQKWLEKLIPDLKICDLNRIAYQQLLNDYAEYHERQTTMDFHHQLKGAVLDAVDEGLIDRDPTRKAIIKGKAPSAKKIKYLNQFELHTLLASLELKDEVNWDYFILLVAKTGMRFSEALALTPKDFDFYHQTLSISKTWDYKGASGFQPTKNKSSVRKIQIDWQSVIRFSELVKGLPEDQPIFVDGKVYNSTVNDVLSRHCERCNIPVISIHGLRHTHASLLLFTGVSIASVARRLGHSSMTTTQKTYLHIIQELENKDIDLVMRSLSGLN